MLVPVIRFLTRPLQMFASAMMAWVMFVAAYDIAGFYFRDLFQVLRTPFQALDRGNRGLRNFCRRILGLQYAPARAESPGRSGT